MIIGYTDEACLERERREPPVSDFAWIAQVYDDGVSLQLGDGSVTRRHWKHNTGVAFEPGQKVLVQKAGGEYVVICPIGPVREERFGGERTEAATMEGVEA